MVNIDQFFEVVFHHKTETLELPASLASMAMHSSLVFI